MRRQLLSMALVLAGLLSVAAHGQTVRIGAGGAVRRTADDKARNIPAAAAETVLVVPGSGAHTDDGTQKVYVVPGSGAYAGT